MRYNYIPESFIRGGKKMKIAHLLYDDSVPLLIGFADTLWGGSKKEPGVAGWSLGQCDDTYPRLHIYQKK